MALKEADTLWLVGQCLFFIHISYLIQDDVEFGLSVVEENAGIVWNFCMDPVWSSEDYFPSSSVWNYI